MSDRKPFDEAFLDEAWQGDLAETLDDALDALGENSQAITQMHDPSQPSLTPKEKQRLEEIEEASIGRITGEMIDRISERLGVDEVTANIVYAVMLATRCAMRGMTIHAHVFGKAVESFMGTTEGCAYGGIREGVLKNGGMGEDNIEFRHGHLLFHHGDISDDDEDSEDPNAALINELLQELQREEADETE